MQIRVVLFWGAFLFIGFLCVVGLFQLSQSPDETEKPTATVLEETDKVKSVPQPEETDKVEVRDKVVPVMSPVLDTNALAAEMLSKISPATLEAAKQNGVNLNKLLDTSIDVGDLGIDASQILKEWGFDSWDEYMASLANTPLPTDSDGNPIKPVNRTPQEIEASIKKLETEIEAALLWLQENPEPRGGYFDAAQRQQRYQRLSEQLSSYFIFDESGRIVGETELAKRLREMDNPSFDESPRTPALENPVTPSGNSPQKWSPDTFRTTTRANLSQLSRNINKQYFDVIVSPYLTQDEFDTLYPTRAARQELQQRQSALQSELVKQVRKLLSPNRENRSQEVSIIQDVLRGDYGNDIADGVIKQLNE